MKKSLVLVALFVVVVMVATTVFAASASTLGADVYAKLSKYGVTANDRAAIEKYVREHNVTDEEAAKVLAYANQVASVFEKEGITDYTKLSSAGVQEIKAAAYAAADVVGAKISITTKAKTVTLTVLDDNNVPAYTVTVNTEIGERIQDYTGSTVVPVAVASIAVIAVAAIAAFKVRKEA